jgi:hypothetical protein
MQYPHNYVLCDVQDQFLCIIAIVAKKMGFSIAEQQSLIPVLSWNCISVCRAIAGCI